MLLTGVTSFLHFRLGNVDPYLVGALVIGSIPGGLLGSHLSTRMPVPWLRRILCAVLLATGARMFGPDDRRIMHSFSRRNLARIHSALEAARQVFSRFTPGAIEAEYKIGHDPVTEADRAVDAVLRQELLRDDEGWLSEESVDDFSRLDKKRVWVVDPLDGTREFVAGIPEFCVSIAMVEDGRRWRGEFAIL